MRAVKSIALGLLVIAGFFAAALGIAAGAEVLSQTTVGILSMWLVGVGIAAWFIGETLIRMMSVN